MLKPPPPSPHWRSRRGAAGNGDAAQESSTTSRQPVVRYVGFRSTSAGREYTLTVLDVGSSRDFVLRISHEAFASRDTRFQDAPDVCSAKLRRELAADPELLPGADIVVTTQDLLDYRNNHLSPLEKRARSKP
jgi:hypothetical protein